jgi:hypothetical protein
MKKDKKLIAWARRQLLRNFIRYRVFGKHHWREDTLKKRFPDHLRKYAIISAKELKRKGILICKPTPHGKQWWLNRKKMTEINEILEEGVV